MTKKYKKFYQLKTHVPTEIISENSLENWGCKLVNRDKEALCGLISKLNCARCSMAWRPVFFDFE